MTREEYNAEMDKVKTWEPWLLYAKILWGEARGEPREGKVAVCFVMHRRQTDGKLRNDITDPWQFSCLNIGDPNFKKLMAVNIDDAQFRECIEVAFDVILNCATDPTRGADHYFNGKLVRPTWAENMTLMAKYGRHEFYKS